ncbi:MAG: histidine kinase [Bacillota bacterium]|nr:histidine kinase [Bacillota bacterium]
MFYSKYQKKLKKQIIEFSFVVTLTGFLGFIFILFIYTTCFNSFRTKEYNKILSKSFTEIHYKYTRYLNDLDTRKTINDYLNNKISPQYMSFLFNSFNLNNEIKSDIIINDASGNIAYSSFDPKEITMYFKLFSQSIFGSLKNKKSTGIYKTVYYFNGDYSKYVFSRNLYYGNRLIGGVSVFLSGDDWNHQMKALQFDGIITDMNGNVIACSNRSMVDGLNQFRPGQKKTYAVNNQKYWMNENDLDEYQVKIFTFVNNESSNSYYLIGCFAFSMIFIFLLAITKHFAGTVANINAASVESLLSEINIIQNGDFDHRIKMESDDEFENIAEEINQMLDNINALSKKNLELLKLKNIMESKQLEAQFNPHFLYNTLECIRYSIILNQEGTDKIITKLTALLRRSISDTSSVVLLKDDLKYLTDYLEIIKYRFQGKFSYEIEIDRSCNDCFVPKLLLQPILENSIKYGFKHKKTLAIRISGWTKEGFLYLEITDNGSGMNEQELDFVKTMINSEANGNEHKGLHNIARRLKLLYGEESGMEVKSTPGKGTVVLLRLTERRLLSEI